MKITKSKFLTTALFAAVLPFGLQAQTITWGGTDGEYTTPGNWVGGVLPDTNGGETALITAGNVTYTPGGDLPVHNGGTLQVSGGSWTQAGGPAWIQMTGGNLVVDGGVFNQGSSGNIVRDASSSFSISAGTANLNGDWNNDSSSSGGFSVSGGTLNIGGVFTVAEAFSINGSMSTGNNFLANETFTLNGGTLTVGNEFKPLATSTVNGGTLFVTNVLSFSDGPGSLDLTAGTVSVNGTAFADGIYGGDNPTKSLNFTTGSTGKLVFRDYTLADLTASNYLNNSTITLNGAVSAVDFSASQVGSNVEITVIPEPSSILITLMGIGLVGMTLSRRK